MTGLRIEIDAQLAVAHPEVHWRAKHRPFGPAAVP